MKFSHKGYGDLYHISANKIRKIFLQYKGTRALQHFSPSKVFGCTIYTGYLTVCMHTVYMCFGETLQQSYMYMDMYIEQIKSIASY